jgi:hypothetical protein
LHAKIAVTLSTGVYCASGQKFSLYKYMYLLDYLYIYIYYVHFRHVYNPTCLFKNRLRVLYKSISNKMFFTRNPFSGCYSTYNSLPKVDRNTYNVDGAWLIDCPLA